MTPAALIQKLIEVGTPAELVVEAARLFERYQAEAENLAKVREQNRIRKQNQRSRHVTSRDVTGHPFPPKETSPRPPKEITPQPPTSLRSVGGDKRGSRLSADWKPSNGDAEFALKILPQGWRIEADKFRDYWIARPGQQGCKLDWSATWRNWIRKAAERKPNGHKRETLAEQGRRLAAKFNSAMRGEDGSGGSNSGGDPDAISLSRDQYKLFG